MSLTKLISTEIPPIQASDTADNGLIMMDDYKVKQLPVVSEGMHYCGLVSENELYNMPDSTTPVGSLHLSQPFADIDESIFGVINKVSKGEYSLLPVIDSNYQYQGYITPLTIIQEIASLTSAEMPGGEIELESEDRDFSPALISGVAENNSMKITSMLTQPNGSHGIRAIIKLNGQETSSVIQGLERNGYRIRNVRHGDQKYSDLMEDRYKALVRYMEM